MTKQLIPSILIALTLFLQPVTSPASTKEEAIRELVEVMNTKNHLEASLDTMEERIKINSPSILNEVKVILARELDDKAVQQALTYYNENDFGSTRLYNLFKAKFNTDLLIDEIIVPVYSEHYSEEEIRQLLAFYKTDLGQKTIRITPQISKTIAEKIRDTSHSALSLAKTELAEDLKEKVEE